MRSPATTALVAALALTTLAACGDDDTKVSPATTPVAASTPPAGSAGGSSSSVDETEGTYAIVPDAVVTAGFVAANLAMTAASATGALVTQAQLDAVEEAWGSFEGTVKQNEPELYLQAEEALDAFFDAGQAKDAAAMTTAAADFKKAADAYLAKHP